MTKDEALKQAREWIKAQPRGWMTDGFKEVIADINEALAQPAQEPVAWMYQCSADNNSKVLMSKKQNWADSGSGLWKEKPLYTTPLQRPWVGLTQEQFTEAARLAEDGNYLVAFQRIQQWLKEANT